MIFNRRKVRLGYVVTMSANGTLTLVKDSLQVQVIRGTLGHSIKLPAANTMREAEGVLFTFINESTQSILILNDASVTLMTLVAGGCVDVKLADNSTANGVWRLNQFASSGGGGIGYTPPGTTLSSLARAIFAGGTNGGDVNTIDSVFFVNLTDATDFGDLTVARNSTSGLSSSVRAVFVAGYNGSNLGTMDYVTIASNGNATNFGTLGSARFGPAALSNDTRGLIGGGNNSAPTNDIQFITIATPSASSSFGNLVSSKEDISGAASTTRGLFLGGAPVTNAIDTVQIATAANATSYGTLVTARYQHAACANATTVIVAGGSVGPLLTIERIIIESQGSAANFGELTLARRYFSGGASRTQVVIVGGLTGAPAHTDVMDTIKFSTGGTARDFGNLSQSRYTMGTATNAHGGLA